MSQSRTVTIGPARVLYHDLFTPKSQGGNAEEKRYSLTILIPKSDTASKEAIDASIEVSARDALHSKWNGAAPLSLITPIHDGDGVRPNGEEYGPECAGCYLMTAKSSEQPEIVDANLRPIMNPSEIYRGIWVYVSIHFFSYMRSGKKGIGCLLGPVMKYKDDEPLGGRVTAKTAFAALMKPAVLGDDDAAPFDLQQTAEPALQAANPV